MLFRAFDAEIHRLPADHLAVARIAVDDDQGSAVDDDLGAGVRVQGAAVHAFDITRQHADAVAVMAHQVRHDEIVGDEPRLLAFAAAMGADFGDDAVQFLVVD